VKIRKIKGVENGIADYLSRYPKPDQISSLSHNPFDIFSSLFDNLTPSPFHSDATPSHDFFINEYAISMEKVLLLAYTEMLFEAEEALQMMDSLSAMLDSNIAAGTPITSIEQMMTEVHNQHSGHYGSVRTMRYLDKHFPGHGIPYETVYQFVESCPTCQKERINLKDNMLKAGYRTIKQPSINSAIGVDDLTISPADKHGYTGATVIANLFSKLAWMYPYISPSAEHVSNSVIDYFCHFGVSNEIHSDPGSVLTGNILVDCNKFFGSRHEFSLTDVHESNGIEPVNKSILRHLRALLTTERVKDRWSEAPITNRINYTINIPHNSELSHNSDDFSPFTLTFGSIDKSSFTERDFNQSFLTKYMEDLNADFKAIHETSKNWQQSIVSKRLASSVVDSVSPGDLVMRKADTPFRRSKLTYRFSGPFVVISQYKNDISVQHLCSKAYTTVHISTLKRFFGTDQQAMELAVLDNDEFWLKAIDGWLGTPTNQRSILLHLIFDDNTDSWNQFDEELIQTALVEKYIASIPELYILSLPAKMRKNYITLTNKNTPAVNVDDTGFLDLRYFGFSWFHAVDLPNSGIQTYLVQYTITTLYPDKRKFDFIVPMLDNVTYSGDSYFLQHWGYRKDFDLNKDIIITKDFVKQFPKLLSP